MKIKTVLLIILLPILSRLYNSSYKFGIKEFNQSCSVKGKRGTLYWLCPLTTVEGLSAGILCRYWDFFQVKLTLFF